MSVFLLSLTKVLYHILVDKMVKNEWNESTVRWNCMNKLEGLLEENTGALGGMQVSGSGHRAPPSIVMSDFLKRTKHFLK